MYRSTGDEVFFGFLVILPAVLLFIIMVGSVFGATFAGNKHVDVCTHPRHTTQANTHTHTTKQTQTNTQAAMGRVSRLMTAVDERISRASIASQPNSPSANASPKPEQPERDDLPIEMVAMPALPRDAHERDGNGDGDGEGQNGEAKTRKKSKSKGARKEKDLEDPASTATSASTSSGPVTLSVSGADRAGEGGEDPVAPWNPRKSKTKRAEPEESPFI